MRPLLVLVLLLIGAHGYSQGKLFYFYPSQNVYYNTQNKQYLFQDHGRWTSAKSLPAAISIDKKERVSICSGTSDVLQDSAWHKQVAEDWINKNKKGVDTTRYVLRVDRNEPPTAQNGEGSRLAPR